MLLMPICFLPADKLAFHMAIISFPFSVFSFQLIKASPLFRVSFVELIDTPARIDHLLFAREKGVALRADFDLDYVGFLRAAGRKSLAASAFDFDVMIVGVNIVFHNLVLSLPLSI